MDFGEHLNKLSQQREAQAGSAARQRVIRLLDAGSLVETDAFASHGNAVTGYGLVNERPVFVVAQDAASQGGAMSMAQARKIVKTLDLAGKTGAPVVLMPDSKGAKVGEGSEVLAAYAEVFSKLAGLRGLCPLIALVQGEACGTAANFVTLCDIAIAVSGAALVTPFAPSVLNAVAGTALDAQALGGAAALAREGVVALVAKDEAEALVLTRSLVDRLPSCAGDKAPLAEGDDLNRLLRVPPADSLALMQDLCDQGSALELYSAWGQGSRTFLARVGGYTVGLVGCLPEQDGGRLDAISCEKITRMVSFCDAYDLPLITLVDSQGLKVPGAQGQSWLMTAAAGMLGAYAEATTAKLAVITGDAVGAAYVTFAGKAIADICFAWPEAYIAPLTRSASVQTFQAAQLGETDRAALERTAAEEADAFHAAAAGLVDQVIAPEETRKHLIMALELLAAKQA
ncbi:MAG: carboxyl transferase domain-containing protein [Christensenellales bacterium]